MKPLTRLTLIVVALCGSGLAQTNLFLHDSDSAAQLSSEFIVKRANSTQGTGSATAVINGLLGPVTGQYWPSSTVGHIWTKTGGGQKIVWFSDPLAAGVTLSGTVTPNVYCLESNPSANIGFRYEILRWSKETGGVVSSLGITAASSTECPRTTPTLITALTLTLTSTAFSAGDRIVIVFYNDDAAGKTENSVGKTGTINYDGATGGNFDSYFTFAQTLSFTADTAAGSAGPDYGVTN